MNLGTFGDISARLARNPLGIIALAFVLVYAIAGLLIVQGSFQPNERIILVWFLVLFPIIVLGIFYRLVSKHHDKLYAPSDFNDENHFMRILESKIEQSPKLNHLEELTQEIQKEINNQPLYRYTKLTEAGKILILMLFASQTINLSEYATEREFEEKDVEEQTNKLVEYGWVTVNNGMATLTIQGKDEIKTFEDICYGRMR